MSDTDAGHHPFLVAIEGIDRAGKTTQTELLRAALADGGEAVEVVSFPRYDSFFGRTIRRLLDGRDAVSATTLDPRSMSLWYALDRWDAFRRVESVDGYLLLNRYTLSNAVYQSSRADPGPAADELFRWVLALEHDHLGLPVPDLTIVLDVDPALSRDRSHRQGTVGAPRRDGDGHGTAEEPGDRAEAPDVYERSHGLLQAARQRYVAASDTMADVLVVSSTDGSGAALTPAQVHDRLLQLVRARRYSSKGPPAWR